MDPLTLLGLGALLAFALKRKPAAAPLAPVQTTALAKPDNSLDPAKLANTVAGGGAALVAGLTTLGVAPATLLVGGATVVGAGVAGALGYEVGGGLDKLLGGDGKGPTGQILRFGLAGLSAGTVVGCVVFGVAATLSATGIGALVVALTWIVATVISDLERLHFGQDGAKQELAHEWKTVHDALFIVIRQIGVTAANAHGVPLPTDADVERIVAPLASGYILEWNRLRYETWMHRTWGLGVNRAYHAQFGLDRGYFVGPTDPNTGDLLYDTKYPYMFGPVYQAGVDALPSHVQKTATVTLTRQVPKTVQVAVAKARGVDTELAESVSRKVAQKTQAQGAQKFTTVTTYVPETYTRTDTFWTDPRLDEFMQGGKVLANVSAYAKWMNEPWLIFENAAGHARAGRDAGYFTGDIDEKDGSLVWNTGLPSRDGYVLPTRWNFAELR